MHTVQPVAVRLADYRPPAWRVLSLSLTFALDPERTRVTAISEIERLSDGPLVLDGEDLALVSIAIDGRILAANEYTLAPDGLTIADPPAHFTLAIASDIAPSANTALEGLYMSPTSSGAIFCTQCEAQGFRRITFFLDRPDVLTHYTTRIEADRARYPLLLSNGNRIEAGDLPDGRHYAVWRDPFPKPCYLFALVAGDLGVIRDTFTTMSGRDVDIAIYVEHGNEARAAYAMDAVKRAMRWDETAYGREYDLDIFMIVAVGSFNAGAMENKGLNIFNDKLLLASPDTATDDDYARIESVIGHEYFHNWSGDRVTCRDWFQLSLKEGFTVFRDQSFSKDQRSAGVCRINDVKSLRGRQFLEDAGPMAHPVQPDSYIAIDNFYTATVYEKGAEVIGMLKTLLGPDGFRKATDLYFARHDGHTATVEDWVTCFEDASRRDLTQFRLWYHQAGTPAVAARGEHDAIARTYALTLTQTIAPTPGQPLKNPLHIPVRLGLLTHDGAPLALNLDGETSDPSRTERVLELTQSSQRFVFTGIDTPPLLSLARGFSAPARYLTPHTREDQAILMGLDADAFNRWEAGQSLSLDILLDMAAGADGPGDLWLDAIGHVIARAPEDHAFAALMLAPPLEHEIAHASAHPDPDAINAARVGMIRAAATRHHAAIRALYDALTVKTPFSPDAASAGRRALRNVMLRFLTAADDAPAADLAMLHYTGATSMTDMIAGLAALGRMDSVRREAAFAHFADRFADDPLVLDKWFGLQAQSPLPGTVDTVRALMDHPAFDIRNPNRVRALIGAFSVNHLRFHGADGHGYALLADVVARLDALNPQVAARMMSPFEPWRRYDPNRQALMRAQLERLKALPGLSSNLFEVVTKLLD